MAGVGVWIFFYKGVVLKHVFMAMKVMVLFFFKVYLLILRERESAYVCEQGEGQRGRERDS